MYAVLTTKDPALEKSLSLQNWSAAGLPPPHSIWVRTSPCSVPCTCQPKQLSTLPMKTALPLVICTSGLVKVMVSSGTVDSSHLLSVTGTSGAATVRNFLLTAVTDGVRQRSEVRPIRDRHLMVACVMVARAAVWPELRRVA